MDKRVEHDKELEQKYLEGEREKGGLLREILNLRIVVVHFFLLFVGGVLVHLGIGSAEQTKLDSTLYAIGISVCTIGLISLVNDLIAKRSFLNMAREIVDSVVRDSAPRLETLFERVVKASMPPRYLNIKDVGIIDAYTRLDIEMVREKIESSCDTEIRIMKIWFPNLYSLESALIKAIETGGCTVKIMLLDPDAEGALEAIKKRSLRLPYYDEDDVLGQIRKNIKVIESIRERLQEDSRGRLKFKLANSFIAASLYGYGETFVLGLYLSGKLATEGVQVKVAGSGHSFYSQIDRHFKSEWEEARDYFPPLEEEDNGASSA